MRCRLGMLFGLLGILTTFSFVGCGGTDAPISAETSKLQAADDDPAESGTKTPPTNKVSANAGLDGLGPQPDSVSAMDLATGNQDAELTDQQMVEKIQEIGTEIFNNTAANPEDQKTEFNGKLLLLLDFCSNLYEQSENADVRFFAAKTKMQAFQYGLDSPYLKASQETKAFAQQILSDEDIRIAQMGRDYLFALAYSSYLESENPDHAAFLETFKKYLAESELTDPVFFMVRDTLNLLYERAGADVRSAAIEAIIARYENSDSEDAKKASETLKDQLAYVRAGYQEKMGDFFEAKPGSAEAFVQSAVSLANRPEAGSFSMQQTVIAADALSMNGRYQEAANLYQLVKDRFGTAKTPDIAEAANAWGDAGLKRISLLGKPFEITGFDYNGEPVNAADYAGKVVLVHYWATVGHDLGFVAHMLNKYQGRGFEVLGVNMDVSQNDEDLSRFYRLQPPPFTSVFSAKPEQRGFDVPLAKANGINQLGYSLLLDRDGRVIALNLNRKDLEQQLAKMMPAPAGPEAAPAGAPAAAPAAAPATGSSFVPDVAGEETYFVVLLDEGDDAEATEATEATEEDEDVVPPVRLKRPEDDLDLTDDVDPLKGLTPEEIEAARKAIDAKIADVNPYKAPTDLKGFELVEFIFNMQDRPKIIQRRPGFSEALVEAADRLINNKEASDRYQVVAADAKFNILHRDASFGDVNADKQLMEFVDAMKGDERAKIKTQVEFFQRERKVIDASDAMAVEEIPAFLEELKTYYGEQELEEKHLRMASSTVAVINRLEDGEKREEYFKDFGNLFAKSENKELRIYGMKLAMPKGGGAQTSELVGKELELEGETVGGEEFAWKAYRGKVVIVDFWATWCGPCLREMPKVKALYEDYNKRGLDVVGISLDKDEDALADFIEQNEIAWSTLKGEGAQDLASKYGVRGIPTMMLIDKEGKVVAVSHNVDAFAEDLTKLLKLDEPEGEEAEGDKPADEKEEEKPADADGEK